MTMQEVFDEHFSDGHSWCQTNMGGPDEYIFIIPATYANAYTGTEDSEGRYNGLLHDCDVADSDLYGEFLAEDGTVEAIFESWDQEYTNGKKWKHVYLKTTGKIMYSEKHECTIYVISKIKEVTQKEVQDHLLKCGWTKEHINNLF